MNIPAISVIMGVYNGEHYLKKAIDSILSQTFTDFEFIIINDGSKDSSGQIIDDYARIDSRIVAVHQDNMGHANSLNKALSMAKAHLIARMDADDIALPERFEKQIEFLNDNKDVAVLGCSICLIDSHDNKIKDIIYDSSSDNIAVNVLQGSPVAHPTVMMRTNIIRDLGGYRAVFDPAEDYDLWLRVSEKYKISNLSEIHLLYRQHSEKLSFKNSEYQILCTNVLQLASKSRRLNNVDPLDNVKKITINTLKIFNLTSDQEIDIMYKTYIYTLYNLSENNDQNGILELLNLIDKNYKIDDAKKLRDLFYLELFRNFYNHKNYSQVFYYLGKSFQSSPFSTTKVLSKVLLRKIIPSSMRLAIKSSLQVK